MQKLVTALCILFLSTIAHASLAYDFASRAIAAFETVRVGTSPRKTEKKPNDPIAGIQNLMRQSQTQTAAFRDARVGIGVFLENPDKEIRESTSIISESLRVLEILGSQTTTICENFLNDPRDSMQAPGTAMRKLFDIGEKSKAGWRGYIAASTTVSIALTASDREIDGKLHYLKITREERDKLKSQLLSSFGSSIKQGAKSSDRNNILPAALLWEFLSDNWKCSDE